MTPASKKFEAEQKMRYPPGGNARPGVFGKKAQLPRAFSGTARGRDCCPLPREKKQKYAV